MRKRTKFRTKLHKESGITIIIAMLALLVASTIAVGMMCALQSDALANQNYRRMTQSRYAAEAGALWAANWIKTSYTQPTAGFGAYTTTTYPATYGANGAIIISSNQSWMANNYSDATVATNFSNAAATASSNFATASGIPGATFEVSAQLLSIQGNASSFPAGAGGGSSSALRWKIVSKGSVGGISAAATEVTVTAASTGTPMFPYAVFATGTGCSSVNISNNGTTNSYNSTQYPNPSSSQFTNSGAGVGTNGNVSLVGGSTINGNVDTGYSGTSSSSTCSAPPAGINANNGGKFTGTQNVVSVTYPTINPPVAPPTTTCTASAACQGSYYPGTWTMAPGQYGNVSFGNGDTIQLQSGVYELNSISVQGGVTIKMPTTGTVTIYVQGTGVATPINFSNGTIANSGGIPSNLQIIYGGSGAVQLGGGTSQYAVIYAPNAPVTINNNNAIFGAVVGNTVTWAGGATVHYDTALQSMLSVGGLEQESFTWNSN